jgi:hypothetical protein
MQDAGWLLWDLAAPAMDDVEGHRQLVIVYCVDGGTVNMAAAGIGIVGNPLEGRARRADAEAIRSGPSTGLGWGYPLAV